MKVLAVLACGFALWAVALTVGLAAALGGSGDVAFQGGFQDGAAVGLDEEQLRNATISLSVADELKAPSLAVLAMVVSAFGESDFRVVANRQGSGYCGVFQADPDNVPCDDTKQQAMSFLQGGLGFQAGGAIHLARTRPQLTPGTIAYLVEGSRSNFTSETAAADHYDVHRARAEALIEAWRAGGSLEPVTVTGKGRELGPASGTWLVPVPGTGARCDKRIAADVLYLLDRYHLALGDCYAASGHAAGGEHPLGLGIDVVPRPPGTWDTIDKMVHDLGWRAECAATGCAGQTGTNFRFIGWDGYPNHGRGNHAHLSWDHGPGTPARTVRVMSR